MLSPPQHDIRAFDLVRDIIDCGSGAEDLVLNHDPVTDEIAPNCEVVPNERIGRVMRVAR
jgi:hypothetical protein